VAAIIVTVIFGLPTLWQWIENRLPPKVTVQLNLGAEEMVAPDRHNSWARSANKRYAVVRVQNRRGIPFPLWGHLDSAALPHPLWFQAVNTPRIVAPKETTHYHFEMEQVGDPAKASFTLMSHGWRKAYRFVGAG